MFTVHRGFRKVALAATMAAVAVLAAACSSNSSSPSTTSAPSTTSTTVPIPTTVIPTQPTNPAIAATVPAAVKSKGGVTVAMDATYPPNEFIAPDGSTIVGMDADLVTAVMQVLGLKPKLTNVTFDTSSPASRAGSTAWGPPRSPDPGPTEGRGLRRLLPGRRELLRQGGELTHLQRPGLAVRPHGGRRSGNHRGVRRQVPGQVQVPPAGTVTVLSFGNQSQANLAVSSGRADVGFADSPVAAYIVATSNGVFQNSGSAIEVAPYGFALPKGNGMAAPVQAAVNLPDRQRRLHPDPRQVGRPGRCGDHFGGQRRHQLRNHPGVSDDGTPRPRSRPSPGRPSDGPDTVKVVPVRHPGRWVAGAAILVLSAMLVNTLVFSHVTRGGVRQGRFQWGVVGSTCSLRRSCGESGSPWS